MADRFCRTTGLYRLILSEPEPTNIRTRQFPGLNLAGVVSHAYTERLVRGEALVFGESRKVSDFDSISGNSTPFWKTGWSGFDPKDFWEVARGWQWLPAVIGAKGEGEQRQVVERILDWLDEHPYPNGLAWAVGLDVAIRAINLLVIAHFVPDERYTRSLRAHAHYLRRMLWLSRNAIRNNHYLGELTAVALLSAFFGDEDSALWRVLLEREIQGQFFPDGVNVEQSIRYHKFSMEFVLLARLFLRIEAPVLEKAGDFLVATRRPDGTWPSVGDDDLGCVIRLHEEGPDGDHRSILGILALLFDREDFAQAAGRLYPEAELLIPAAAEKWAQLGKAGGRQSFLFPDGGFFALKTGASSKDSTFLVKFGPHKWHAHADLFHVELSLKGIPVLADSGTYRYNGIPGERRYFRGTAAHNTLSFNGADQTRQLSTFRWIRPAGVKSWDLREEEQDVSFTGAHNGYARFGVLHRRGIRLDRNLGAVKCRDCLEGKGSGPVAVNWHFQPGLELKRLDSSTFEILLEETRLATVEFNAGGENTQAGLEKKPFSSRYGELQAMTVLSLSTIKRTGTNLAIETTFKVCA